MRDDIFDLAGGRFAVGTSSVITFAPVAFQNNFIVKLLSGGSSGCFIGGASLAVGLGAGLSGFLGGGYCLITAGEALSLSLSGPAYFTAAGSTAVITISIGKTNTAGATLI